MVEACALGSKTAPLHQVLKQRARSARRCSIPENLFEDALAPLKQLERPRSARQKALIWSGAFEAIDNARPAEYEAEDESLARPSSQGLFLES